MILMIVFNIYHFNHSTPAILLLLYDDYHSTFKFIITSFMCIKYGLLLVDDAIRQLLGD